MSPVTITHPNVLSAELQTDKDGKPFLEIMTDLRKDDDGFSAMTAAVEELRRQLPPHRRGDYVTYIPSGI